MEVTKYYIPHALVMMGHHHCASGAEYTFCPACYLRGDTYAMCTHCRNKVEIEMEFVKDAFHIKPVQSLHGSLQ